MFHYSPSSRSQGYAPYLPRRSNFSASFDINDTPSPTYALEDLGYPPLSQPFVPRPINAETRYRRALYELEAAEQEYQNQIALEARARQMAAIRQRAAAEAARREREIALYAEVERINHARALQEQVEERLAQRQRGLRTQVGDDGGHRGRHAFMRAVHGDAEGDSALRRHCAHLQADNETSTIGDLLGLFAGVHPECQRACQCQRPTSPTASQPRQPAEPGPHSQPQVPERENAEFNLGSLLEFFQSIATQARGAAGGEQSTQVCSSIRRVYFHCLISASQESFASQPEAKSVDGKGKGKAKAEPVPEPSFFETLLQGRGGGAHDQELRDLEYAIKLSLQDRDATDAKKAQPSKASQSSASASSYKVSS